MEPPAINESFQMQECMKGAKSELYGGLLNYFQPNVAIRSCCGSVWVGIVMKHHNTSTKHATSLVLDRMTQFLSVSQKTPAFIVEH
jgi:hypothetical protein